MSPSASGGSAGGPGGPGGSRILLLGAGHAHLHALSRASEYVRRGHELVLVTPGPFWYSGLATGVLAGRYPRELDRLDVRALVEEGGGLCVEGRAQRIDAPGRRVLLEDGREMGWDLLSVAVGSEVDRDRVPGARGRAVPVKPIPGLLRLKGEVERRLDAGGEGPLDLVVLGGGASGVEVAGNLEVLVRRREGSARITLLTGPDPLLSEHRRSVARKATALLEDRGVRLRRDTAVEVEERTVRTANGERIPGDVVVDATGLVPAPVIRDSGLPVDVSGALRVDRFLRCVDDEAVFGGGDCVHFTPRPLPGVGVYAVRQGPVLHRNLLAAAAGDPLEPFRPQRRHLLVLNLGDGVGLAVWGPFSWKGRLAFRLKDWLDRRFLRKHRPAKREG